MGEQNDGHGMKFPHDERLRGWLDMLCNSLNGHDPEDIVIVCITIDRKTMAYHIDQASPGPEFNENRKEWAEVARSILSWDLTHSETKEQSH